MIEAIAFAENAYRGDRFEDTLRQYIAEKEARDAAL
jgi:hypothetical protein